MRAFRYRRPKGFTMIELLVALFVVAVGILGLAGMRTASMQSVYGSYGRTQAIGLAYGVVDRMRANRDSALSGNYDIALSDAKPSCGTVATCDLNSWLTSLETRLPAGDGSVAVDSSGVATIQTQWNPSRLEDSLREGQSGSTTITFTVRTRL